MFASGGAALGDTIAATAVVVCAMPVDVERRKSSYCREGGSPYYVLL